jgi:triacylglycerol lipase
MSNERNCTDLDNPRWLFHPEEDPYYEHFVHILTPFAPDATSVTPANACWLADAALLAYWEPEQAQARCQRVDLSCEPFSAGGTEGYVMVSASGRWAMVAFRGTQPDKLQDLVSSADFGQVEGEGGRVHRGFSKALAKVADTVGSRISALAGKGLSIWMCGHSLGAALATLAAMRFRDSTRGICTVGSPRVGDGDFVAAFDRQFGDRSARYVNGRDLVARVPLRTIPVFGSGVHYAHVGALRSLGAARVISDLDDEQSSLAEAVGNPGLLRSPFRPGSPPPEAAPEADSRVEHRLVPASLMNHMPKAYACGIRAQLTRLGKRDKPSTG